MRLATFASTLMLLPTLLGAQQNAVDRLRQVLPAHIADQVIAIVTDATSRGLPGDAVADRALEARAKGRSGDEMVAAARSHSADLASARVALERGGHTPDRGEIESAAGAMKAGVDGQAISELASSAPSGRSLAVPIAVITALMNRGLPSDAALQAVHARLVAKAADRELLDLPGAAGRLIAEGHRPADVGNELGQGRGVSSQVPKGPPATVPAANGRPEGVPANGGQSGARPEPQGRGRNKP
jgi:hypothetical protein